MKSLITRSSEAVNRSSISTIDSGLMCLVTAARFLGISADYEQLKRDAVVSADATDIVTILYAAPKLGIKAKQGTTALTKLQKLSLPVLALLKNGRFVAIVKADKQKILVFDPYKEETITLNYEIFSSVWTGDVIFLTRRLSIADDEEKFNFSWFIQVVMQYKRLISEVLVMSFFLQGLGLITPLFMQVILDKVLVYKGFTTLDILTVGLLCISLFEGALKVLRAYLFSHTINRIDVKLGAKLFNHLLDLPLKYFENTKIGVIVARVK
jgi:subfamily B ATP-binding cassette protein HlyB/CyaB